MDQSLHRSEYADYHGTGRVRTSRPVHRTGTSVLPAAAPLYPAHIICQ